MKYNVRYKSNGHCASVCKNPLIRSIRPNRPFPVFLLFIFRVMQNFSSFSFCLFFFNNHRQKEREKPDRNLINIFYRNALKSFPAKKKKTFGFVIIFVSLMTFFERPFLFLVTGLLSGQLKNVIV